MPHPMLPTVVYAMAALRAAIGLAPFVAAGASARLLGFPPAQDVPAARLFARVFGVRDVALGALAVHALQDPAQLPFAVILNACCDAGDAVAIAVPLLRRQGIDRAAVTCLGFALTGLLAWLVVLRFLL